MAEAPIRTIEPPPWRRIAGTTAWQQASVASSWEATASRTEAMPSGVSMKLPAAPALAATASVPTMTLQTSTSGAPSAAVLAATTARTCSRSLMSPATATARPPDFSMSATTPAAASALRR